MPSKYHHTDYIKAASQAFKARYNQRYATPEEAVAREGPSAIGEWCALLEEAREEAQNRFKLMRAARSTRPPERKSKKADSQILKTVN